MPAIFESNADLSTGIEGGSSGAGSLDFLSDRNLVTYLGMGATVVTAGGALAVAGMVMPAHLVGAVATSAALVGGGMYLESQEEADAETKTETDTKPAVKAEVEVVAAKA